MITGTYPPSANGVAVSTKRTVEALRSLGHTVWIIGPKPAHSIEDPHYIPFPTIHIPFWRAKDYPLAIPSLLGTNRLPDIAWDVIHVHHPLGYLSLAHRLGKQRHVPVVFTYHTQNDEVLHRMWHIPLSLARFVNTRLILAPSKHIDGVIATTRWLQSVLVERIGKNHVHYASTAGFIRPFSHEKNKKELRHMLGLPQSGPIFLTVSRIVKEKGLSFLLESFERWHKKHTRGTFVVIGDGTLRSTLEAYAASHGMKHAVVFAGKVANENLHAWYSAADIFLYGSLTDTIGINIIEAMSAGLPVVASAHITTEEVIRSGVNGILTDRTPKGFVYGMDEALQKQTKLSAGAKKTAAEYHIRTTVEQLLSVYQHVIRHHKTP